MKTQISAVLILGLLGLSTPAFGDVYVAVDAQGNAVSGAIMCDAATCGAGSQFSKLTLQPGQSYQLQGYGQSGIGNNNPGVDVKVDIPTQTWTVTHSSTPEPVVTTFVPTREVSTVQGNQPRVETSTATTDTASAIIKVETATVTMETATAVSVITPAEIQVKMGELRVLLARIATLLKGLLAW